jgi:UDP-glucuronate decarboxylase
MNTPKDVTGPINIGNPSEFTIRALAEMIIEQTGSQSELAYLPLPQDDPRQRKPDITLARERLGWQPRVPLADGLKSTIAYFRERQGGLAGGVRPAARTRRKLVVLSN